jgi:membrane protease subunit (stomatin/prohibitin family)
VAIFSKVADVIQYEGDNKAFIWKHPAEDFNASTQLVVHQSQEAIFFMNGEALDLFGPGRHTLTTENIPLIRGILNWATGGETPFHCEVYFINKTEQMAIKWGTDSKVEFMEPAFKFPIQIGASGEMSLKAENARQLLLKLVGTEKTLGQTQLVAYFRAFLMTRVKSYLAQTIREQSINIFEIDEHLNSLSDALREKLAADFADYGVSLEKFLVTTIVKPDGDPSYEKFKSLHFRQYADVAEAQLKQTVGIINQETEARKTVIEAEGLARKRSIEGYTYQQERGLDVAEMVANNEGAGNMTAAGIGLGMMTGVGGVVGGMVGGIMGDNLQTAALVGVPAPGAQPPSPAAAQAEAFCENCGTKTASGAAFCDECGAPVAKPSVCGKCGHVFERPGKFCPKCGAKREE